MCQNRLFLVSKCFGCISQSQDIIEVSFHLGVNKLNAAFLEGEVFVHVENTTPRLLGIKISQHLLACYFDIKLYLWRADQIIPSLCFHLVDLSHILSDSLNQFSLIIVQSPFARGIPLQMDIIPGVKPILRNIYFEFKPMCAEAWAKFVTNFGDIFEFFGNSRESISIFDN